MKMHVNISKALVGFIAGALFMAAVGSTFAATTTSSVIPNFTAMKIGTISTTPSSGQIIASGSITGASFSSTGTIAGANLTASGYLKVGSVTTTPGTGEITASGKITGANLVASSTTGYVKTSKLMPTSTTITVDGNLNVLGSVKGISVGNFYVLQSACGGASTACTDVDDYDFEGKEIAVSCNADDTLISCQSLGKDQWAFGSDLQCTVLSDEDTSIGVSATCFSPDGTGVSSTLSTSRIGVLVNQQYLTETDELESRIYDYFAIDLGFDPTVLWETMQQAETDMAEFQAFMGGLATDGDGQLDVMAVIEDDIGGTPVTESWITSQSYATKSWVGNNYTNTTEMRTMMTTH